MRKLRIDLDTYPGVPKQELMQLFCKLYRAHRQARPYVDATLAFNDMKGGFELYSLGLWQLQAWGIAATVLGWHLILSIGD